MFALAIAVALLSSTERTNAQVHSENLSRYNKVTSAIDGNGVRHRGTEYKGAAAPWLEEYIGRLSLYPYEARRLHQQGLVIVHVVLDLTTGKAQSVKIAKSSGSPILDNSALNSIGHWKWPAGKWKEIEMPMEFEMEMGKAPGPEVPDPWHRRSS